MPQVINTNIMSVNAQRQLNKSQLMQNEAMSRLSSGLRINSAKDDAAGLAISTGMESQVRGINQAVRNANDGISMAQTAEGAMDEMTNILQRMRELSVQAANDTNSASNRASIQEEVDQLYSELDRIAGVTQFNGVNLLDGSAGATNLQIGANKGETLGFTIDAVTTKDLNLNAVSGLGELNGGRVDTGTAITNSEILLNDVALTGTAAAAEADGLRDMINAKSGQTGVVATSYNVVEGVSGTTGVTSGLEINGNTVADSGSMQELVDNINRDVAGVTATLSNNGAVTLTNDTGESIEIAGTTTNSGLDAGAFAGYLSLESSDDEPISIEANTTVGGTTADVQVLGFNQQSGSSSVTGGSVNSVAVTDNDKIEINGVELGAVTGTSAADKAFAINAISDQTGVTASASTSTEFRINFANTTFDGVEGLDSALRLQINGVTLSGLADDSGLSEVIETINSAGLQGVVASATEDGFLKLESVSGQDIKLTAVDSDGAFASATGATGLVNSDGTANTIADSNGQVARGEITLTGEDGKDVVVSSGATTEADRDAAMTKLGLTDTGGNDTAVGIGLSVTSVSNAENSIERIDEALEKISSSRGKLGAVQNRLQSTISNLENVSQNLSAANSRIKDADFASETSKLSKSQILQQAGTSMLAQANAAGQSVLSLLG